MRTDNQPPRGADLIFLSEFPLGILTDRATETNTVIFELRPTSRRKRKQWIIDGAERFGLPNYIDLQVFLMLLAYTKEQGFPDQVHFCRNQLIRDLGWPHNQGSYDRLHLALDRLTRTSYTAINHYPDPKGNECSREKVFILAQTYELHDSRVSTATLPPSWIRWSEEVACLLETRQMKTLDLDLLRSLKLPVSQQMYRYLHTRGLDNKTHYEENFLDYACERLGLSRDFRWPADLKRTLDKGHQELIERGVIESATYAKMEGRAGEKAQQKVVIQFPSAAQRAPAEAETALPTAAPPSSTEAPAPAAPPVDPLIAPLVAAGLSEPIAVKLAAAHPEECARQLDYLPYRARLENPGGALRQAILEAWAAPEAYRKAQRAQAKAEKAAQARAARQAEADAVAARVAAFQRWWSALSPAAQEAYLTRAEVARADINDFTRAQILHRADRRFAFFSTEIMAFWQEAQGANGAA